MDRRENLTSAALLEHVQALILRTARGRTAVPARAYLEDAAGRVTRVELPPLTGQAEHSAAGAIIGAVLRDRAAVCAVLQLPHQVADGEVAQEIVGLYAIAADGRALGERMLVLQRGADGRIAGLMRAQPPVLPRSTASAASR
jgi:hypothetical protein